jgi:hypothetical protein
MSENGNTSVYSVTLERVPPPGVDPIATKVDFNL